MEKSINLQPTNILDIISPTGFNYLSEFIHTPFPLWVYQPGDFTVKKKVFMVHNSNTTCILYDIDPEKRKLC